jgi:hypothetical protein
MSASLSARPRVQTDGHQERPTPPLPKQAHVQVQQARPPASCRQPRKQKQAGHRQVLRSCLTRYASPSAISARCCADPIRAVDPTPQHFHQPTKKKRQVKGTGTRSRQLAFAFDRLPSESCSLSLSLLISTARESATRQRTNKTLSALQEISRNPLCCCSSALLYPPFFSRFSMTRQENVKVRARRRRPGTRRRHRRSETRRGKAPAPRRN